MWGHVSTSAQLSLFISLSSFLIFSSSFWVTLLLLLLLLLFLLFGRDFPRGSDGKESASNAGKTQIWSLVREDSLQEGMSTHSSILAWRIPWTEETGRLQSMGLQRVRHDWATHTHTHTHIHTHTRTHFLAVPFSMWDPNSLPKDWTDAPCTGSDKSLNHWRTREVLGCVIGETLLIRT